MSIAAVTDKSQWIRHYAVASVNAPRLVCLPHAGGSASYYLPTAKALAPHIEVLAIQYPGRQDRLLEDCVDNIHDLAALIAQFVQPLAAQKPLALFGHSMGAGVGFEVARLLQQAGTPAAHLFVSGRQAPHRHEVTYAHLLDDLQFVAEIRQLNGSDDDVLDDPDLRSLVLPAIRSDYKAAETYEYRPGARLTSPITALTGDNDSGMTLDAVRAWSDHTSGAFNFKVFTGGHFFLNDHQGAIQRGIRAALGV
ncbi:thioesterase II family protein [Streptomyces sp. NPDC059009]|uniref:thioesterase II family protein n=1 Tax=Streptomyces sp. NPDC059009 TaxID=3346694 RepID=UPI0036822831